MEWRINLEIDNNDGLPYYDVMFEGGYIFHGKTRIYIDNVDEAIDTLMNLNKMGFLGVIIGKLWARWQTMKMSTGCPPYHTYWEYIKEYIKDTTS